MKEGFDPNLGARPLKRVIQRLILDPLSMKIVTNEIPEFSKILIDEENDNIVFRLPKLLQKAKDMPKLVKAKR